jgi:hypothetical protein
MLGWRGRIGRMSRNGGKRDRQKERDDDGNGSQA